MSKRYAYGAALALLASLGMAGCDMKPTPPRMANGRVVDRLALTGDAREEKLVTALETARVNYEYRLLVLRAYYQKVGNIDKYRWAELELENLRTAQLFRWEGLKAQITAPAGEPVENADEVLLAEYIVRARNDYRDAAVALEDYYKARGETFKADVLRNMQDRHYPERTYCFFINAEIPPADLKPREANPEAEKLYEEAYRLFKEGRPLPLITSYRKERRALVLLLDLVRKYPTSTRVAYAAYHIGYIYKEYFNEDVRAVKWLERAFQWDPAVPLPARFEAAVVYDHRLHNREKGRELYKEVIKNEQFNRSNVDYAQKRLEELEKK